MKIEEMIDEYDEIILHDAEQGYRMSLEVYLKHKPECLNRLYRNGEFKWTLLIAACYHQHEDIVQMLVNQFNANVETKGNIVFQTRDDGGRLMEGVTPLWVAAAVNNFNIVKFLVQFGRANVNHLTKEHSTPVRVACYNGNLEMVKFLVQYGANPHQVKLNNYTNLSLAVIHEYFHIVEYLVDVIKCDLNQADIDGITSLHNAVENNSIIITKFLLSRGALNLRDGIRNITPLMMAAANGKTNFVSFFYGHCSLIDWIEAQELLGSVFAGCLPNQENMNMAVECLTHAFEARMTHNIPKLRLQQTSEIFNHHQECETLEDLNELVSFGSQEHFYLEALLIQERILGTVSKVYHESLINIGHSLENIHQYDLCFRLWFYEIDLRRKRKIPFNEDHLRSISNLFEDLFLNNNIKTFIKQFFTALTIMIETLSLPQDDETFDYNLITLLHLVTISAKLLLEEHSNENEKLSLADCQTLIKTIRSIVSTGYATKNSGLSLLHLCCDGDTASFSIQFMYPCLSTVRLLLICGMDVNIMDTMKNTVLHILTRNIMLDDSSEIIDFLCDTTNIHMDFANEHGDSAIDVQTIPTIYISGKIQRLRERIGVPSLKCRCARLAKYYQLAYKDCLSSSLVKFVHKH